MLIIHRKKDRVLWCHGGPGVPSSYEWTAPDAPKPATLAHPSRRQANLAWQAEHPPARPGRPRVKNPRDGNKALQIRLEPALLDWVRSQGGSAYVRSLIEQDKQNDFDPEDGLVRDLDAWEFAQDDRGT